VTKARNEDAEYYRVCAAEMMAKAQAAPSKGIRQAYLNLALKWGRKAWERAKPDADRPVPDQSNRTSEEN
jgi:hypothetical protein